MRRNAIISPHFGQPGLLITFTNTAYPPDSSCTIGLVLRKSCVLKVTDVWKSSGRPRSNHERFFSWKQICTMLPASELNRPPNFWVYAVTFGRPYLCDPNLQSLLLLLRRSLARRLLRLLRANPRPARRAKETSVPALPLARKPNTKKARPQGRARAAVPRKATRRIHRLKTTLVPGAIPWLLRKAAANIDISFEGWMYP
jgi:hypothetical protein